MTLSGMTTEADVLLRLAGEIDDLGRRLAVVGAELRTARTEQPKPAPQQAAPAEPQPQPAPQQAAPAQPQP
ncbi:DUF2339 domain-containing protein, partial [Amycolatopsis sp. SID8362]|nr:DUF2339 domain-containing protein [Amycolatopsis sp. SID8362]NED45417.1 DUF2339 domain-containing protein [Amycolatopsis sp. SID8362]